MWILKYHYTEKICHIHCLGKQLLVIGSINSLSRFYVFIEKQAVFLNHAAFATPSNLSIAFKLFTPLYLNLQEKITAETC